MFLKVRQMSKLMMLSQKNLEENKKILLRSDVSNILWHEEEVCGEANDCADDAIVQDKIHSWEGGDGHQEEGEQHGGQVGDLHPPKQRWS